MMPPVHATDVRDLQRQLDHDPILRAQLRFRGGAVYVAGHRYQISTHPPRALRVNALGNFFDTETAREIADVIFRPAAMNPAVATMDPAIATMVPATPTLTPSPTPSPAPVLPAAPMMPAMPTALSPQRARRIQQAERRAQQTADQRAVIRPLRPGLPNIGHRSCYLNAVVFAIARPWTETGITARLIAADNDADRPHPHHHHHHTSQRLLRQCLGSLLSGIETHASNLEARLRRFRRALALYADNIGHSRLQAMLPLNAAREVDDSNLRPEDPEEFFQYLVDCLGFDGDPSIYLTRCVLSQTLGRFADNSEVLTSIINPEVERTYAPQLMLPLLNIESTLQGSIDAFFGQTDTATGTSIAHTSARLAVGDIVSTTQEALMAPGPDVLTLTVPINQEVRMLTAYNVAFLGQSNQVTVPVVRQSGSDVRIERQRYQVESVICLQEREPPADHHYLTLIFDNGTITICDSSRVEDLGRYRDILSAARASAPDNTQALMNFFTQTDTTPEMIMLTRVDNGASGSSSDTSPQPGTSRDSKP